LPHPACTSLPWKCAPCIGSNGGDAFSWRQIGWRFHIPNQPDPSFEPTQKTKADVDLPRVQAMARGGWEGVVSVINRL
jgi:hypothetical protein